MNMKFFIHSDCGDFVGIVNRQFHTIESTHELNVWIVRGKAKVGERCKIFTEKGLIEVEVLSIKTSNGYVLEIGENDYAQITFTGLPINVTIPWKSVVSTQEYTMEEYASLPFKMIIDGAIDVNNIFAITGRISQGTIKIDDKIIITNDKLSYITYVDNIEFLKQFFETRTYGEYCGLYLYNLPEHIKDKITAGSIVSIFID